MGRRGMAPSERVRQRLDEELAVIDQLGYPSYFLTVADVVDLIKSLRVRAAARGSGAGSLVTYLLGISDVDPLRYGLLMERFLSPLRHQLPDIDIDVESARRMEVYDAVIDRFGADRVSCISMMDTYRVRHAIRDVGAALGLPPAEIDAVAKAFPHIRANQVHAALQGPAGAAGQPAGLEAQPAAAATWTCCSTSSPGSTGCPGTSRCTRAGCCSPTPPCSTARRSRTATSAIR